MPEALDRSSGTASPDPRPLLVGNDVVDLADPRCVGRSGDRRFLERILSVEEARRIRSADRPDTLLWLFWAAKEAAYKVVSKLRGEPPPFVHARFQVAVEPAGSAPFGEAPPPSLTGTVTWEEHVVPFRATVGPERIHAVAWWGARGRAAIDGKSAAEDGKARDGRGAPRGLSAGISVGLSTLPADSAERWREDLSSRFTPREWAAVHSRPSAVVRLEARAELARRLDAPEREVEIVCPGDAPGRTPPQVLRDSRRARADVSLSHHGRFVAWAVAIDEEEALRYGR